jgi:LruC domain-containing protein
MSMLGACGGGGGEYVTGLVPATGAANGTEPETVEPTEPETQTASASTSDLQVPATFDWSSAVTVSLNLQLLDIDGQPAAGVGFAVYAAVDAALDEDMREPFAEELEGLSPYLQSVSASDGSATGELQLPGHVAAKGYVYVVTQLMGVAAVAYVPITQEVDGFQANGTFGPETDEAVLALDAVPANDSTRRQVLGNAASGDYFLQPFFTSYNYWYGHPQGIRRAGACDMETMVAGDLCNISVQSDTLKMIGEALPEGGTPATRFLNADASGSNLEFSRPAKVMVSFLHEGAGYRNTFGFFSYDPANPPASHDEVDTAKVLFPNTSLAGSGGGLRSGASIFLGEIDPANGDAGLGFWLAANGWSSGRGRGYNGHHFYTLSDLNPESHEADRKHIVMLGEEVDLAQNTRRFWLGFEDIRLDYSYSDKDYNDLIVQVEVSPADALANSASIPVLSNDDAAVDADEDGVTDTTDIDDNDASRAFEQYYPGENEWGTLLAEDNWPLQGDYDMNDMGVRYRVREVLNSGGQIKDVEIEYQLQARGAAFHNGFAVSLGDSVFADNVESVTLNGESIDPIADAVYLNYSIFDDAWAHTWQGGSAECWTFHTLPGCDSSDVSSFDFQLTFANPVERSALGAAPYNPYLYAHKVGPDLAGYTRLNALGGEIYRDNGSVRDIEIHLPHHRPTSGQDLSLFGAGDDASNGVDTFYINNSNLPWMIDVPFPIDYPAEFIDISRAYPAFIDWVQSGGEEARDWYRRPADAPDLTFVTGSATR